MLQKCPFRCTRTTESNSSSLIEKIILSRQKPALFTTMLRSPKLSTARLDHGLRVVPVGDVAEVGDGLATGGLDLVDHGLPGGLVLPAAVGGHAEIVHHHLRALLGQLRAPRRVRDRARPPSRLPPCLRDSTSCCSCFRAASRGLRSGSFGGSRAASAPPAAQMRSMIVPVPTVAPQHIADERGALPRALELVERRHDQPRPGGAHRVAQRDRPAIHVHLRHVRLVDPGPREHDGGESLVDLEEIDVRDAASPVFFRIASVASTGPSSRK